MLRKITVYLNISTALAVFYVILFKNSWFSEGFGSGGWVLILALATTFFTGIYLKITRFEKESYLEGQRRY